MMDMQYRTGRRGFTMVELMLVMLVIFLLIGLLIGGFRFARSVSRKAVDTTTVNTLKQNVAFFQEQLGFLPPLVKDMGDQPSFSGMPIYQQTVPPRTYNRIRIYQAGDTRPYPQGDLAFLRYSPDASLPDMRFSIYSLPYYLIGACDVPLEPGGTVVIDGVSGPGMKAPKWNGSFESAGRRFEPFFDIGRSSRSLVTINQEEGRVELRDSNGVAFRYYRWEHGKHVANANNNQGPVGAVNIIEDLNVPRILGDPRENPELKGAKYAILGAGANGLFGNEHQLYQQYPSHPQAMKIEDMATKLGLPAPTTQSEIDRIVQRAMEDNVMEVGK